MSRHNGFRALRRLITASVLVAVGLALTPIGAHAAGWRTATAQGFGLTQGTGSANAERTPGPPSPRRPPSSARSARA